MGEAERLPTQPETRFVQEMYVGQCIVTHYDLDTVKALRDRLRAEGFLAEAFNTYVVDGLVVEREKLGK